MRLISRNAKHLNLSLILVPNLSEDFLKMFEISSVRWLIWEIWEILQAFPIVLDRVGAFEATFSSFLNCRRLSLGFSVHLWLGRCVVQRIRQLSSGHIPPTLSRLCFWLNLLETLKDVVDHPTVPEFGWANWSCALCCSPIAILLTV